jgi:hypothetical protein
MSCDDYDRRFNSIMILHSLGSFALAWYCPGNRKYLYQYVWLSEYLRASVLIGVAAFVA